MAFVALASLSVNVPWFRKGGIFTETPFGTRYTSFMSVIMGLGSLLHNSDPKIALQAICTPASGMVSWQCWRLDLSEYM